MSKIDLVWYVGHTNELRKHIAIMESQPLIGMEIEQYEKIALNNMKRQLEDVLKRIRDRC